MNIKKISALCIAACALTTTSAMAWESADGQHTTSASVALSTEYVWRGVTRSDEKPAISGSFDYGHASGLYAGTWATSTDNFIDEDSSLEIRAYAGYANELANTGVGYDVGVLRYMYPGSDSDWNEGYLTLSYSLFSASVKHTTDVLGTGESATHYSLGFDYDLPMGIHLNAGIATWDFNDVDDTFLALTEGRGETAASVNAANLPSSGEDYAINLTKEVFGFDATLSYIDSLSDGEELATFATGDSGASDNRVVFSISKSL